MELDYFDDMLFIESQLEPSSTPLYSSSASDVYNTQGNDRSVSAAAEAGLPVLPEDSADVRAETAG